MSLEFDTVHREMLARIPDRYQKTAGFPAYDFTAAFAQAVLSLDDDIATAEANLNVDNLTGVGEFWVTAVSHELSPVHMMTLTMERCDQ